MSEYEPGSLVSGVLGISKITVTGRVVKGGQVLASGDLVPVKSLHSIQRLTVLADDEVVVKADDLRAGVRPSAGAAFWPETRRLRDALDAHDAARTPQIEEPQGLGAVVEDVHGRHGVRHVVIANAKPWRFSDADWRSWDEVDAPRILSEGVRLDEETGR